MKNRLLITISDIHGSKQYSIHEIVKKIILILVLIFLSMGLGTFFYIKFLSEEVDTSKAETTIFKEKVKALKSKTQELTQIGKRLEEENKNLNLEQEQLLDHIGENTDKLDSVNKYLRQVEDMIGIEPDMNASYAQRIQQAKVKEEKKEKTLFKNMRKKVKQANITAIQKALLLNNIPNGKPLNYRRISSNFGYRIHPVTKRKSFHSGLDLPAKYGTPIYAPASGAVVYAQKKGHYGNFILISHSYGFQTAYGHLSRYAVKSGEYVSKGQKIGYVGSTGRSTGPHLHYEVRYFRKLLDPKKFMFLDLDNINHISDRIASVNWKSILKQTEKLISLSTK